MKKHKLDNLFSDKLSDHQSQPSPQAWEALEESLEQNSEKFSWAWVGIAASAILVAVSSWYMLSADNATNTVDYAYSENQTGEVDVPVEIVLVPVFIQAPANNTPAVAQLNNQKAHIATTFEPNQKLAEDTHQQPVVLVDNIVFEHQLAPVIQEPLPLATDDDELIIASTKETIVDEQQVTRESLTIIYKQGDPESKSNFTKAINYMEDVRNGDKKLVNFKKIGEGIKSKFKSNKDTNSK